MPLRFSTFFACLNTFFEVLILLRLKIFFIFLFGYLNTLLLQGFSCLRKFLFKLFLSIDLSDLLLLAPRFALERFFALGRGLFLFVLALGVVSSLCPSSSFSVALGVVLDEALDVVLVSGVVSGVALDVVSALVLVSGVVLDVASIFFSRISF